MDPDAYAKHNKPEEGARVGVYKHPNSDEELWAENFPAADAFVRQGWKFDRPLPSAEERRQMQAELDAKAEAERPLTVEEAKALREEIKQAKEAQAAAEQAAADAADKAAKEAQATKTADNKKEGGTK